MAAWTDVDFTAAEPAVHEAIDAAYPTKYEIGGAHV